MQSELQKYNLFFKLYYKILTLLTHRNISYGFIKHCTVTTLLITFFFSHGTLYAQQVPFGNVKCIRPTQAKQHEPHGNDSLYSADPRLWTLSLGVGLGHGKVRDMGTAPILFGGPALYHTLGIGYERMRWRYQSEIATALGYYEDALAPKLNFTTFDISNRIAFYAMRRLNAQLLTQEWLGVGIRNYLDVTVNTNYENAAAGISDFVELALLLRGAQQLGSSRWLLQFQLAVSPLAAILRPGYAYIDNYTAAQPVLNVLFDDYQWNLSPVPSVSTEIGFRFTLLNGNEMEWLYCWDYHSSGNSGFWRFDHAMHTLQFNLLFALKGGKRL